MDDLPTSDEDLWQRVVRDDQVALRSLFDRHFASLCEFAHAMLKRPDWAEEVVSDVFIVLYRKRSELNVTGKLRPYLFRSVRNRALNRLRDESATRLEISFDDFDALPEPTDPAKVLLYREFASEVERLLASIPAKQQVVFRLHRVEGFTHHEIAEILGISPHTVRNHMVAALRFLDRHFRPDLDSEFCRRSSDG